VTITDEEQRSLRERFRGHWQDGVPFNAFAGLRFERWDDELVVVRLPLRHELSAHTGMLHGGVIAALVDACAAGAVMAGHDYTLGSRLTTVNLSVQYLSAAPGEDALAEGRCLRRGRALHFAEARVFGADSGKLTATGQVTVSITGRHRIVKSG